MSKADPLPCKFGLPPLIEMNNSVYNSVSTRWRGAALLGVMFLAQNMVLYALCQSSNAPGTVIWSVPLGSDSPLTGFVYSSPGIGSDGSIYVGTGYDTGGFSGNRLYSISPHRKKD